MREREKRSIIVALTFSNYRKPLDLIDDNMVKKKATSAGDKCMSSGMPIAS